MDCSRRVRISVEFCCLSIVSKKLSVGDFDLRRMLLLFDLSRLEIGDRMLFSSGDLGDLGVGEAEDLRGDLRALGEQGDMTDDFSLVGPEGGRKVTIVHGHNRDTIIS